MIIKKIINWIWHAIFYVLAPPPLRRYAMTCKETVREINTSNNKSNRLKLHLSLCRGCLNYFRYSEWLQSAFPKKKYTHSKDLSDKIFKKIK